MFDIGFSELILVIIIAVILFDVKDAAIIIKKTKKFFSELHYYKNKIMQIFEDVDHNGKLSELKEDLQIDFTEFSKEFLEPLPPKNNKQKKDD